jgi:hypothetical protein
MSKTQEKKAARLQEHKDFMLKRRTTQVEVAKKMMEEMTKALDENRDKLSEDEVKFLENEMIANEQTLNRLIEERDALQS